jgi:hypothetical protein
MSGKPFFDLNVPLSEAIAERRAPNRGDQTEFTTDTKLPMQLPAIVWSAIPQRYLDLVGPCTEAPVEFHLITLIVAIGCLIGRRCWVMMPHATFPNFYALLIGETGDSRKTTAYRFGIDLLRDVSDRIDAKVKPLFGLASIEGLAAAMKDGDSAEAFRILAVEDEFKSLIRKGQQKSTSNLIPRLTELYNTLARFEVNTKADRIVIQDPFLSVISSTTDTWFAECMSESEISGGFLNRWVVLRGKSDKLIAFPEPVDDGKWQRLVHDLAQAVQRASGRFTLSDGAKEVYSEFYRLFRTRQGEGLLLEATSRGHLHAIKFGLVYAVLAGHSQIEADDIKRGIALAVHCGNVAQSSAVGIGQSRIGKQEQQLLTALRAGRLSPRDVLRRFGWSADELSRLSRGLQHAGLVDITTETTTAGRRRVFIESRE